MRARRLLPVAVLAALVFAPASPAAADPAGPTHYRSTVTDVEPNVDGLEVDVLGGDAYVVVRAAPGLTVDVDGYEGEPYVRIEEDGTVLRNEASPSRWLNEARFGGPDAAPPPEASAEAPPRWEQVATDGAYAWHDHRVHWMSPQDPRHVDTGADTAQPVQTWELELTVDGQPVTIAGELVWRPGGMPWPAGLAVAVAALAGAAVWRRPDLAPWVAAAGVLPAAALGVAASVGWPPGADTEPALLLLPGVTLLLVGVARLVRSRPGIGPQLIGALTGVPLLVAGVLWSRALTAPIVPTALPDAGARVLLAVTLGVGVSAVVAAARRVLVPTEPAG